MLCVIDLCVHVLDLLWLIVGHAVGVSGTTWCHALHHIPMFMPLCQEGGAVVGDVILVILKTILNTVDMICRCIITRVAIAYTVSGGYPGQICKCISQPMGA